MTDYTALENPIWSSLTGAHAHWAIGTDLAKHYPPDISPFFAISDEHDPQAWRDLAELVGVGGAVNLSGRTGDVPAGWEPVFAGYGLQLIGEDVVGEPWDEAVDLTDADVPMMLELIERTKPGPFERRTIEFGGYVGIKSDGVVVAMAGRRLNPEGWVEISAVCTDEAYRGRGYGTRLVLAVVDRIRADGLLPFMHASALNVNAIRLYESLGFRERRRARFERLTYTGP